MSAVEHKLPVKVVVFNNAGWGLVHVEMEAAGLPAFRGTAFPNMDFAAFARACGAEGFLARQPSDLEPAIRRWLAAPGPAVLDVFIDPDELPSALVADFACQDCAETGLGKARDARFAGCDGAGRMQLNGRILSTQRVEWHSLGTKTRVRRYTGHECKLS